MNLLSIGAGLGAVNAVFNWGWAASALGVTGKGPVESFFPVVMFSVLFGLSMDYQVYLVSRIQEEWHHQLHSETGGLRALGSAKMRNHHAVSAGQANSSRIITAAAGIMVLVFASFLLSDRRLLQEFGFGLGFSVLIDALIIRGMVVPALMHLAGPANWALPSWLETQLSPPRPRRWHGERQRQPGHRERRDPSNPPCRLANYRAWDLDRDRYASASPAPWRGCISYAPQSHSPGCGRCPR